MATETMVYHGPSRIERLSPEDFETASIRSAAPSYISEAPSYHTLPPSEAVPAYTPPSSTSTTTSSSQPSITPRQSSPMLPLTPVAPRSTFTPGAGLPPIPRRAEASSTPSLSQFRIPSWSSMSNGNPQARHYQSVANRRVAAASATPSASSVEGALRAALSRINAANADGAEEDGRVRPLEDPYLVGEEAAARARRERLARKHGDEILIREDRRWDWWHAQMRDVDERERSWNAFRSNIENGSRRKFARRFGR
ncbi:hypothetical protein F5Y19DRAFT_331802 [Xylariaceae sp. FL1651]|nr:hypothetical protein F5Y19DRAFT_331802 [Xylariaceae sp. FL1651]